MGVAAWSIADAGEVRTDNQGVTTTYYRLIIQMESLDDNLTALQIGLPQFQRFQPHPNNSAFGTELTLYVSEFQAVQKKHSVFWDGQVTYTDQIKTDPLAIPLEIGEVQTYTIPGATVTDYAGNAILNAAGEPPEPFDFPERVMQIPLIKNIAADLPSWLFDWEDCVNADVVMIGSGANIVACPPKTLLISSVKISTVQEMSGTSYRTCTIEVLRRKRTWEVIFPNRGFNQLVTQKRITSVPTSGSVTFTTETSLKPILIKGEVPTEPQFLDSKGAWIPHPSPSDVVLLKALLQRPVPFSQFPLQ